MFTCILGYIAGKYKVDFSTVLFFAVVADISMWQAISEIFS